LSYESSPRSARSSSVTTSVASRTCETASYDPARTLDDLRQRMIRLEWLWSLHHPTRAPAAGASAHPGPADCQATGTGTGTGGARVQRVLTPRQHGGTYAYGVSCGSTPRTARNDGWSSSFARSVALSSASRDAARISRASRGAQKKPTTAVSGFEKARWGRAEAQLAAFLLHQDTRRRFPDLPIPSSHGNGHQQQHDNW
jgi:hypothetical protein